MPGFISFFAGKPEEDGDVSADQPRRRGPDVEESVSGASQDGAVALESGATSGRPDEERAVFTQR